MPSAPHSISARALPAGELREELLAPHATLILVGEGSLPGSPRSALGVCPHPSSMHHLSCSLIYVPWERMRFKVLKGWDQTTSPTGQDEGCWDGKCKGWLVWSGGWLVPGLELPDHVTQHRCAGFSALLKNRVIFEEQSVPPPPRWGGAPGLCPTDSLP